MATMGYCERGEMDGLRVTRAELAKLAKVLGRKYINEVMPVPGRVAVAECGVSHEGFEYAMYWEAEDGSHGWCCSKCGLVIQWG